MRGRIVRGLGAVAISSLVLGAGASSVFAATAKPTIYEAVAGNYASHASAVAYQAKLVKAGFKGFVIQNEVVGKGHYQVEQSFMTKAAAMAEVTRLKAAHLRGGVETDAAGSN